MAGRSVVRESGQSWKFLLGNAGLLIGSFAPLWPALGIDWVAGTVLAVAGYSFLCVAIRCTACSKRWFWEAALNPELYGRLWRDSSCPHCTQKFPLGTAGESRDNAGPDSEGPARGRT